jgi:hypothetical protein
MSRRIENLRELVDAEPAEIQAKHLARYREAAEARDFKAANHSAWQRMTPAQRREFCEAAEDPAQPKVSPAEWLASFESAQPDEWSAAISEWNELKEAARSAVEHAAALNRRIPDLEAELARGQVDLQVRKASAQRGDVEAIQRDEEALARQARRIADNKSIVKVIGDLHSGGDIGELGKWFREVEAPRLRAQQDADLDHRFDDYR